jgi:hypothetical protein
MIGRALRMKLVVATALLIGFVVALGACGSKPHVNRAPKATAADAEASGDAVDRPKTHDAADRARAEAEESPDAPVSSQGKHWGGWQYQGTRDDCFYVVGRRCFTDEKKACAAAKCKSGACDVVGGGPATITCR